jgi:hypothetical protein
MEQGQLAEVQLNRERTAAKSDYNKGPVTVNDTKQQSLLYCCIKASHAGAGAGAGKGC